VKRVVFGAGVLTFRGMPNLYAAAAPVAAQALDPSTELLS
jgi:hypothetical protein